MKKYHQYLFYILLSGLGLSYPLISFAISNLHQEENLNGYYLDKVTCDKSAQYCVTVGYYQNERSLSPISFTSIDSGKSWVASTVPAQRNGDHFALFSTVACDSQGQRCIALGEYGDSTASFVSIDGGKNWSFPTSIPQIKGPISSISCDSNAQQCIAIGVDKFYSNILSLITLDGGKNWSLAHTSPSRPDSGLNFINDMSCGSTLQQCVVVGVKNNLIDKIFAMFFNSQNNGNDWEASTLYQATEFAVIHGVSCSDKGENCTAVGSYLNNDIRIKMPVSYTSIDAGKNWALSTPLPNAIPNAYSTILMSIACDSTAQFCTAVGFYNTNTQQFPIAFITTNAGKNWSPSKTFPPAQGSGAHFLNSVSCDKHMQKCIAVGNYIKDDQQIPISYLSNDGGNHWIASQILH